MRATYRIIRVLAGLLLLALSVSWLLLRRRRVPVGPVSPARRLTVVPPVSILDRPRPDTDEPDTEQPAAGANGITAPAAGIPVPLVSGEANGAARDANGMAGEANGTAGEANGTAGEANGTAGEANGAVGEGEPDDLRAIKGIGPATESALHELGIRTFQQLAVLDGPAREELRVALKDTRQRMEREDWVGQAAQLHRAKYGEDPVRPV